MSKAKVELHPIVRLYRIPEESRRDLNMVAKELGIKVFQINGPLHQLHFPDEDALITLEAIRQGVFEPNYKAQRPADDNT